MWPPPRWMVVPQTQHNKANQYGLDILNCEPRLYLGCSWGRQSADLSRDSSFHVSQWGWFSFGWAMAWVCVPLLAAAKPLTRKKMTEGLTLNWLSPWKDTLYSGDSRNKFQSCADCTHKMKLKNELKFKNTKKKKDCPYRGWTINHLLVGSITGHIYCMWSKVI